MSFITNQSLFKVNQELLALCVSQPTIQAKIECFGISRKNPYPEIPASFHQPLFTGSFSASPVMYSLDDPAPLYAQPQHYSALVSAFTSAFPDFDFSTVYPFNFKLISSVEKAQSVINWAFQTQLPGSEQALSEMWAVLEKEIAPAVCSIYAYEPDRPDAFSESGAIYNMCYFFLNEKTNRVVLVHLMDGGNDLDDDDEPDMDERYGFSVF